MAISNRFIYLKNRSSYDEKLASGDISKASIVFTEDDHLIHTHGTDFPKIDNSDIQDQIDSIVDDLYKTKLYVGTASANTDGDVKATVNDGSTYKVSAMTSRKVGTADTSYPDTTYDVTVQKMEGYATAYGDTKGQASLGTSTTVSVTKQGDNHTYATDSLTAAYGSSKYTIKATTGGNTYSHTVTVYSPAPVYLVFTGTDAAPLPDITDTYLSSLTFRSMGSPTKLSDAKYTAIAADDQTENKRAYVFIPTGWNTGSTAKLYVYNSMANNTYELTPFSNTFSKQYTKDDVVYDVFYTDAVFANNNGNTFQITGNSSTL